MVSSSGASTGTGTGTGSSQGQNSGSELIDQRKQKRMQSNRESARRSRMRKQKHLDDLMAQANELRKENSKFITSLNHTTQQYLAVEADNSVLRTQMMELTNRLQSLREILHFMSLNNFTSVNAATFVSDDSSSSMVNDNSMMPWNMMMMMFMNHHQHQQEHEEQEAMLMNTFQYS